MKSVLLAVLVVSNLVFAGLWWRARSTPELGVTAAIGPVVPIELASARDPAGEPARSPIELELLPPAEPAPAPDLVPLPAADPPTLTQEIAERVRHAMQDATVVVGTNRMGLADIEEKMQAQADRQRTRTHRKLFGEFFADNGFTDHEQDQFIDLLNARERARGVGMGLGRLTLGTHPAELTDAQQGELAEAEEAIRQFLSDEGYRRYLDYDATKYSRADAGEVRAALAKDGPGLRGEQYTALIEIFHRVNGGEPLQQTPNGLSVMVENIQNQMEITDKVEEKVDDFAARLDRVVADAEFILDDGQMAGLRTHFDDLMATKERHEELAQSVLTGLEIVGPDGASVSTSVGVQVIESHDVVELGFGSHEEHE